MARKFLLLALQITAIAALSSSHASKSEPVLDSQIIRWFNQTLDHFTPLEKRTFPQRYFEYLDEWTAPDGPVFLIICGEYVCPGVGTDYRLSLAKKFGAALVALEHRYYGESQPWPHLTVQNLIYLSSKQAVVDLAAFRNFFQGDLNRRFRGTSKADNPWIAIGVSYPGALSAWFHLKFPHLTAGALASSAVVNARLDFFQFDQQVAVSAGPKCAAALRQVTDLVDAELAIDPQQVKKLFDAESLVDDGDFSFLLADAAVFAFQYGSPDSLCGPLVKAKESRGSVLAAYVDYVKNVFYPKFGGSPSDYNRDFLRNSSIESPNAVSRAWWYQCCTELAYFQTAPTRGNIRSKMLTLKYFNDFCEATFGKGVLPDTDSTNLYYGGEKIAGSRIFFVNGSQDPWKHASKENATAGEPSEVVTCHNCGHGSELRGCPQWPFQPLGNASQCSDPNAVLKVRAKVETSFRSWLGIDLDAVESS